ncbi:MAG: hypothetical protein ACQGVK_14635 [Myxococcota bacterium]
MGVSLLLSTGASAQMGGPHGLGAGARPLHLRMADARVAALVEIRGVETGRLRAARIVGLRGEIEDEFEIKRSPSRPPPVVAGDWVLALLDGERSPYLLLDESTELAVVGEAERSVWLAELPAYAALLENGSATGPAGAGLRARYEHWLDDGPESLRGLALRGLLDPRAPFAPLDPAFAARRVRTALDPDRELAARTSSALAATLAQGGATRLLEAMDAQAPVTSEIVLVALQGGLRVGSPETGPALARLLDHSDPGVRARALELAPSVDRRRRLAARIEALAAEDPDAEVRRTARVALRHYAR